MNKVLIIEDEDQLRKALAIKFEHKGFKVCTANNGISGLRLAKRELPDVIMLDLMLPEMAGPEMLQKLRQCKGGKDIKVIVMTNLEEDHTADVENLGVKHFLIKANNTLDSLVDIAKQVILNGKSNGQNNTNSYCDCN